MQISREDRGCAMRGGGSPGGEEEEEEGGGGVQKRIVQTSANDECNEIS